MAVMSHEMKYQGYLCQAGSYRRTVGLSPDTGFVDINMAEAKKITFFPHDFRFRSANDKGVPALLTAKEALRRRLTITTRPPLEGPKGGGFNAFGRLEMKSIFNDNPLPKVFYDDVYVAPSGLQQVIDDISNIRAHDEGVIRVQLTDIRNFYRDHSPFLQRINARLRSGRFDSDSTKENNEPFTFQEVIGILFSQLPGSPAISGGELSSLNLAPPEDIIGEGQPIVQIIQNLLDKNGLVPLFQPDGNYKIRRPVKPKQNPNKVRDRLGNQKDITSVMAYERKTVTITDRPSICIVLGKKKIRRNTLWYIPVFQDIDGTWRRLEDIKKLWGYDLEKLNKQVFTGSEKQFSDVPGNGDVFFRRVDILKAHAYKSYAPAAFFIDGILPQQPAAGGAKARGFLDKDIELLSQLPMVEAPLYEFQRDRLNEAVPADTGVFDADDVVMVPPIVSAAYLTSSLFTDFSEVKKKRQQMIEAHGQSLQEVNQSIEALKRKRQDIGRDIRKYDEAVKNLQSLVGDKLTEWFISVQDSFGFLVPNKLFGQPVPELGQIQQNLIDEIDKKKVELRAVEIDLRQAEASRKKILTLIKTIKSKFTPFEEVYKERGAIKLMHNVPRRVVAQGQYALDKETGIITFTKPMVNGTEPFYVDTDSVEVETDGLVSVTYGYQSNWNAHYDYSYFYFGAEKQNEKPKFGHISTGSIAPIPPLIIRAPSLQLLHEERGTPMNFTKSLEKARAMAEPIMTQPLWADGFDQEYDGLHDVALDDGVMQVTHNFDGDVGKTFVAMNAPASRHPLGPAIQKKNPFPFDIKAYEAVATIDPKF